MIDLKKLARFDFGAKSFFDWLSAVGPHRITAFACGSAFVGTCAAVAWESLEVDRHKHPNIARDVKMALQRWRGGADSPPTSGAGQRRSQE